MYTQAKMAGYKNSEGATFFFRCKAALYIKITVRYTIWSGSSPEAH